VLNSLWLVQLPAPVAAWRSLMSAVLSRWISKDRINLSLLLKSENYKLSLLIPSANPPVSSPTVGWYYRLLLSATRLCAEVKVSWGSASPRSIPLSPSIAPRPTNLLIWSGGSLGHPVGCLVSEQAVGSCAQPPGKGAVVSVGSNRWVEDPLPLGHSRLLSMPPLCWVEAAARCEAGGLLSLVISICSSGTAPVEVGQVFRGSPFGSAGAWVQSAVQAAARGCLWTR